MGYESNDGRNVVVHYGPRNIDKKRGGQYGSKGPVKVCEWVFDYDDLPSGSTSSLEVAIPAYAKIVSARLEVLTAFAGGTSYNLGLEQADGTAIDADGIDAGVALAAINARGKIVTCDGALVGASIGSAAGELVVAATGTFTAGKARLVVEYMEESAMA